MTPPGSSGLSLPDPAPLLASLLPEQAESLAKALRIRGWSRILPLVMGPALRLVRRRASAVPETLNAPRLCRTTELAYNGISWRRSGTSPRQGRVRSRSPSSRRRGGRSPSTSPSCSPSTTTPAPTAIRDLGAETAARILRRRRRTKHRSAPSPGAPTPRRRGAGGRPAAADQRGVLVWNPDSPPQQYPFRQSGLDLGAQWR